MKRVGNVFVSTLPALPNLVRDFMDTHRCQKCGKCCREATAGTAIFKEEIKTLARFKNMTRKEFQALYVTEKDGQTLLSQPCPFLAPAPPTLAGAAVDGWQCSIYLYRPRVCRIFPLRTVQYNGFLRLAVHSLCPNVVQPLDVIEEKYRI